MTTSLTFTPIPEFERSPKRIDGVEGVETPKRVDLKELPLGTIVQFYGVHPDSKYITLLTGPETDRQVKIWLKGRGNGVVVSIDLIVSEHLPTGVKETGIMEVGKTYFLPEFYYDDRDNVTIGGMARFESYTKIFVKRPQ